MPPKSSGMPPIAAAIFSIFWFLFMGGMIVAYIIMLVAWWRAMKAHEKIANKLSEIADKFQAK
jgi:nitrate/nitrite transporter NarK